MPIEHGGTPNLTAGSIAETRQRMIVVWWSIGRMGVEVSPLEPRFGRQAVKTGFAVRP